MDHHNAEFERNSPKGIPAFSNETGSGGSGPIEIKEGSYHPPVAMYGEEVDDKVSKKMVMQYSYKEFYDGKDRN